MRLLAAVLGACLLSACGLPVDGNAFPSPNDHAGMPPGSKPAQVMPQRPVTSSVDAGEDTGSVMDASPGDAGKDVASDTPPDTSDPADNNGDDGGSDNQNDESPHQSGS